MASAAEQIKERLSITEVVGSYIKLENAGTNYKAKCPFHNEKSPSFFVSPARGSYYCFGCSAKGDIFSFVQEYEKLDFMGALKILAERAGVELSDFKSEHKSREDRQYKVIDLAAAFFQNNLLQGKSEASKKALAYLTGRGLTMESVKSWKIGFAHDEWRHLLDFMLGQKVDGQPVTDQDLIDVGLIVKKSADNSGTHTGQGVGQTAQNGTSHSTSHSFEGREKMYDRFRSRIMFPLFDTSGRVIAFSGRIFGKDEKEFGPKYLNSPDMELFNKSEVLYGFDKAKQGMREWGYAVLVEGQMDLLMSHQVNVKNAVATSGTALTPKHLEKISRMTKNLVFMYDGDNAGFNATRRGERLAIELGFDVKVVMLPHGDDPASLIQKDKQAFIQALKNSTQIIEYHLGMLLKNNPDQHKLLKAIEENLIPDIALTPSAIRRSELISLVSLKSKIPEKALTEEVEKCISRMEKDGVKSALTPAMLQKEKAGGFGFESLEVTRRFSGAKANTPLDITLRRTIAMLLFIESQSKENKDGEYKDGEKIVADLNERVANILPASDIEIIEELKQSAKEELLFEAEMLYGKGTNLISHAEDLLFELEDRSLKEKLGKLMSDLSLAEKAKDRLKSDEIIQKCQEISLKLTELTKKRQKHFKK